MTEGGSNHSSTLGQRSRKGCAACRARRKKCDEQRPVCQACHDRDLECIYARPTRKKVFDTNIRICSSLASAKPDTVEQDALVPLFRKALLDRAVLQNPLNRQPSVISETCLVNHFRTNVTELICFSCADTGNPFVSHILPLIHSSPLVHTAVEAVAAAHLHVLGTAKLLEAEILQSQTLKLLSYHLSAVDWSVSPEHVLAGSLLLIYYEVVLGNSARTARCHLQGAKGLLDIQPNATSTPCFRFLSKIFQYFDVMVSLSLREAPLGSINCPLEDYTGVDGTFGLVGSLWPMMESLAKILARKDCGEVATEQAKRLETQLHSWSIERAKETVDENDVNQEAILQIANAYKYSCLLTLYSNPISLEAFGENYGHDLPLKPRELLQHVYQQAFDSLLRACVLSGPMSTLTWPLYTVGMHAKSTGDKTIVKHIFSMLNERQHMKVVEAARDSVTRHWDMASTSSYGSGTTAVLFG